MNSENKTSSAEQDAFRAFRSNYELGHPPPVQTETYVSEADWWEKNRRWIGAIITSLALFIASRTGAGVFESNRSEGYSPALSALLAGLAVAGIEGLVAFYGLSRPRKLHSSQIEMLWDNTIAAFSVFLGLAVSALAGLRASLVLSTSLVESHGGLINTLLSLLLGVGLTFVLFGISDFAGRIRFIKENAPLFSARAHADACRAYEVELGKAWMDSTEYLLLRGEDDAQAALMRGRIAAIARNAPRGVAAAVTLANQKYFDGQQRGGTAGTPDSKLELAVAWLQKNRQEHWRTLDDLPSARDICKYMEDERAEDQLPPLNINPSSAHKARIRYADQHLSANTN